MPRLWPERPEFATESERRVWEQLRAELGDDDLLVANQRVTDHRKDHEIDIAVVLPGAGVVVVEVKGGGVRHDGRSWRQERQGRERVVDPVRQAMLAKYALRSYVEASGRWGSRSRVRWGHAVVLPYLALADDFSLPDCPRLGERVQVHISYASDWSAQGLGAFLDDTSVVVDGTEVAATSFETDLGGWRVSGPPPGSDSNANDWIRSQTAFEEGAGVTTDDTVYVGFGVEGLRTQRMRTDLVRRSLTHLLG